MPIKNQGRRSNEQCQKKSVGEECLVKATEAAAAVIREISMIAD